jgi:hypothetical protein
VFNEAFKAAGQEKAKRQSIAARQKMTNVLLKSPHRSFGHLGIEATTRQPGVGFGSTAALTTELS